jgi:serine acetyltransferase
MTDYGAKEEIPDLTSYLKKSYIFFSGDTTKEIHIQANVTPADGYNHKNNIYIGESFTVVEMTNDYNSVIIGYNGNNTNYKNVLIGNNAQTTSTYATAAGYNGQVNAIYGIAI